MTRIKSKRVGKSKTKKEEETKNDTLSVSLLKEMVATGSSKKNATCFPELGFPDGSAGKESICNAEETWVRSLGWEDLWRRERLPTPLFWPGEFHGLYSPWGHKELDTTERLSFSLTFFQN